MKPRILFAILILGTLGCEADEIEDRENGDNDLGSADSVGGDCPFDGDDARGVLELVNDDAVDLDDLDHSIGLDSRAANGIVDARPIASLSELSAVPYVGTSACDRLRSVACDSRGLCEAELRIITWNVEHFPLTGDTIDEVALAIADIKPEIIGFQEVDDPDAFDRLEDMLPGYSGFVGERGFGTRVAILYRRDRLRVTEIEDLYTDDSRAFPRPPLAVTFDLQGRAAKTELTFVVVHLKPEVTTMTNSVAERPSQSSMAGSPPTRRHRCFSLAT